LFKKTGNFKQGSVFWKELPLSVRPVDTTGPPPSPGAGFGDSAENKRVESAAIQAVVEKYETDGWLVLSVERERCGFDLKCTKGRSVHDVEVKGVRGDEQCFVITAGEVVEARNNPNFYLAVVTSALSSPPTIKVYSGTEFDRKFTLAVIQYRARFLPESKRGRTERYT
jgi:hypothetical protein